MHERDRLVQQVAVIGLGRFGLAVGRTLAQWGHEVYGIDCKEEVVQHAKDVLTHVVQAELYDIAEVKELGLDEIDVAVVAIGADIEASILTTTLLLEAGVQRVMTRAATHLHGIILQRVGAHDVIYPEQASGEMLARSLRAPGITEHIALSSEIGINKLHAPDEWVGHTLDDLRLSAADMAFVALAIQRGEETIAAPPPGERIQEGDVLAVLCQENKLDELPLVARRR